MMNTFLNNLKENDRVSYTTNGAVAYTTTKYDVYDMFAMGGAYRNRIEEDVIMLFKKALKENEELAMKCLFYLRDCRGGQGERRFFRVAFRWLCNNYPEIAKRNLENVSEYGRWDDLIYVAESTKLEKDAFAIIRSQLALDCGCKTPSLLAKWLPSENASSNETRRLGGKLRKYLNLSHKEYRRTLSVLRERIKVLEKLMSENRWEEIEFDKIPSKAGLIYKNAFARRDLIAKEYKDFAESKETKVNASTLYPYEIVEKARALYRKDLNDTDRLMVEKYWSCLPDYFEGNKSNIFCMVDTSGSMTWSSSGGVFPINVAISLGMYCAERSGGAFKDHFLTFSHHPELIKFEGVDFVDKVRRVEKRNQCENTDLVAAFNYLLKIALESEPEDIPSTLVVISDMQIDSGSNFNGYGTYHFHSDKKKVVKTEMEKMRHKWESASLKMPKLVYWNVNASGTANILDDGPNVSYVSGCSPIIFKQVITGKTGIDLMMEVLMSNRYASVK